MNAARKKVSVWNSRKYTKEQKRLTNKVGLLNDQ